MTEINTRKLALQILQKLEKKENHLNQVVDEYFTKSPITSEKKKSVFSLVIGVLRHKKLLDYILEKRFHGNYGKSQYFVRNLLRIGLYQLKMEKKPAYAIINEIVKIAKRKDKNAAGLIHAVLQKTTDSDIFQEIETDKKLSPTQKLALKNLHPEWLINRWLKRFSDDEVLALCDWNNTPAAVTIRFNFLRHSWIEFESILKNAGAEFARSKTNPVFVRLKNTSKLPLKQWIIEGWCSVQDEAAGWICHLVDPQPNEKIADLCAAPGGKTTYLSQLVRDKGRVLAVDVSQKRLEQVKTIKSQLKLSSIEWRLGDSTKISLPPQDRVLVDAPCLGTGVFGKRADGRWKKSETDLAQLTILQKNLLENAAKLVKLGGALIYSTCSLEPEENWDMVDQFLRSNPKFRIENADRWIPAEFVDARGGLFIFPPSHKMDGAFAVRMKKNG